MWNDQGMQYDLDLGYEGEDENSMWIRLLQYFGNDHVVFKESKLYQKQ